MSRESYSTFSEEWKRHQKKFVKLSFQIRIFSAKIATNTMHGLSIRRWKVWRAKCQVAKIFTNCTASLERNVLVILTLNNGSGSNKITVKQRCWSLTTCHKRKTCKRTTGKTLMGSWPAPTFARVPRCCVFFSACDRQRSAKNRVRLID